jgi:hypothetical protein
MKTVNWDNKPITIEIIENDIKTTYDFIDFDKIQMEMQKYPEMLIPNIVKAKYQDHFNFANNFAIGIIKSRQIPNNLFEQSE